MKNIRMLLMALASLMIVTQVPVSVRAMSSTPELKNITLEHKIKFDALADILKTAYTSEDPQERLDQEKEAFNLLPRLGGFLGFSLFFNKELVTNFAHYIKEEQLIEKIVLYPFVKKEIVVHLLRYIQQECPLELQGIINRALINAESTGNVIIVNVLIGYHSAPAQKFIDQIDAFLTQGRDNIAFDLIKNFIEIRFNSEAATIALLFQNLYGYQTQRHSLFAASLLQMLSAQQFIQVLNVYAQRGDYAFAYHVFEELVLVKPKQEIIDMMVLFPQIDQYQLDKVFHDEIQMIFVKHIAGMKRGFVRGVLQAAADKYEHKELKKQTDYLQTLNIAMAKGNEQDKVRVDSLLTAMSFPLGKMGSDDEALLAELDLLEDEDVLPELDFSLEEDSLEEEDFSDNSAM